MIVQFRKGDAFRIAIELFVLLFVGHWTEFTPAWLAIKAEQERIEGFGRLCRRKAGSSEAVSSWRKNFKIF